MKYNNLISNSICEEIEIDAYWQQQSIQGMDLNIGAE